MQLIIIFEQKVLNQSQFSNQKIKNKFVIAADMGGTKVNIGLFHTKSEKPTLLFKEKYPTADFNNFNSILNSFYKIHKAPQPDSICIGIAGPVINGIAKFTNLHWQINEKEIIKKTGIKKVALLNDLQATAYGLSQLGQNDLENIQPGKKNVEGNKVLIAPGTGLGISALNFAHGIYTPVASEGGHSEFAPRTNDDLALYQYLKKKKKIVSWEHVVSGQGIENIYDYLRQVKKMKEPASLAKAFQNNDRAAVISQHALHDIPICQHTMKIFVENFARAASGMAITFKATGGVYLCGGIPPKIIPHLQEFNFMHHFLTSDRMNHLLEKTPVTIVKNDEAALLGAAFYGAYGIA